jgi:4'-phosphopantetheinyl transferase
MLKVYQTRSSIRISEKREGEYLERLPVALRAEIQSYRRWEDRQAALFGKLLLLHALLIRYSEWDFSILERLENTEQGKPFIKGLPDFNISHSGEIVTLSLVDDGTTGIDVEKIRPIQLDDFSIYLPEISLPDDFKTSDRLNMIYACWTKKEAVLKGAGSGLQVPLEQVKLFDDKAFFRDQVWYLDRIDCGIDYCCHVATNQPQAGCCVELVYFF